MLAIFVLATDDSEISFAPCLAHETVLDPPALVGPNHLVLVVSADDEVVSTFGVGEDVLALEVATMCANISVDSSLMIAEEVLGCIESLDGATDPGDDRIDAVARYAAQVRRGVWSEHVAEIFEVLGVERPGVADGEVDDFFSIGHGLRVAQPCGRSSVETTISLHSLHERPLRRSFIPIRFRPE